ncbi:G-protein coupled receptor 146 isoform X8 [Phalacrocorax aristotelis]|uniref:G-protein coupled receptor 146 isoform X8 n=1 Tax=Phalacrocorax aristotelis TaxID=126867 RepID=UPI003F4BDECF
MKSLLKISNKESLEFSSHRTPCFQKFCRKEKVAQSQTDILLGCTSRNGTASPMSPENPSADDNTITNLHAPAARIF